PTNIVCEPYGPSQDSSNVCTLSAPPAPLVDLTPTHSGSAMLMLLSVVFVGLAVFVIYKFKRKIPGINVYAQMQNEKEQELISPVSHTESRPSVPHPDLRWPGQLVDEKVESQHL
ncbi:hypothetical protein U0070_009602, partial [Myodes glareolus]